MKITVSQNKATSPRSKVLMFEEQDEHFKTDGSSIEDFLTNRCEAMIQKYGLKEYAFIHHDKDNNNGQPVKPHYHLTMYFGENRPMVSSIADALDTTENQIEIMTKRGTKVETARVNAFMYLIHATRNARRQGKYQYSATDVIANFDYVQFVKDHMLNDDPTDILDDLGNGKIIRTQARSRMMALGAQVLAKYNRKIDEIAEASLAIQNEIWRKEHEDSHSELKVYWFFGQTGTGKTRFAKYLAKEIFKMPYFVTGARRDAMQDYEGQHLIIWDELRDDVEYSELLRLLDPFNYDKAISSRYYNKNLMPDIVIITSPYSPDELYRVMRITDRKIDKVDQLVRRVPIIHEFCHDKIIVRKWNNYEKRYWEKERLPSVEELINQSSPLNSLQLLQFNGDDMNSQYAETEYEPSSDDNELEMDQFLPFYGLDYYDQHPEIDPFTNEIKEKPHYDSPKLRNGAQDSNQLSGSLSHLTGGNDND